MATRYFTGDAGAAQGLNYTRTVSLSGGSALSDIRIDSVIAYAQMSTNAYTNTYQVRAQLLNSSGGVLAEVTRYDIKFDSSNYTGATWEFNFGTAFDQNAIASISFFGLNEASKIFVKGAQSVVVNYTPITACTPPSSISLSASMAAPGGNVTLSWSGAGAGSANPIVGYIIQRSTNGGAWTNWQTDNASPYTVTAHATYGNYYDYRIITDGQYIDSGASASVRLTTYTPTACKAPTSASVAPSLCENDPTLSTSGAAGGTINAITGYEIQYAESANGTTYGSWTALKTVSTTGTSLSTTVTLPSVRGYSRKYRLRTLGAAGASYYSAWKETNAVKRNSLPTAPTSFTASPEVYVSGAIALTYSGATDPDGNLSTHNVQYATKSGVGAWSAWANLTNGITSHTPTLSPGQSIKYRVRAVDALGAVSSYKESNTCVKNTAPAKPTVNYPQAGKTTYNSRPRLLVTLGVDPEGHTQRLVESGFTPSRVDGLTAGAKIVLRRTNAAGAGSVSYSVKSADQYNEESTASTGSLTYTSPSFTDATITGGTTRIKAAHMTELRTMVNTIRQYYGLSAVVWAETITAGITKSRGWKAHVIELQQAISDVVTLVNGWDAFSSVNRISSFAWITPGVKPSSEVMNQIRQVIAWL